MPAAYAAGVQPKPCTTVNKWQERNEEGNEEWATSMRVGAYIFKSMRVGAYIFTGLALTIDLACYHCSCRLHLT
jgi:hypothetical protein